MRYLISRYQDEKELVVHEPHLYRGEWHAEERIDTCRNEPWSIFSSDLYPDGLSIKEVLFASSLYGKKAGEYGEGEFGDWLRDSSDDTRETKEKIVSPHGVEYMWWPEGEKAEDVFLSTRAWMDFQLTRQKREHRYTRKISPYTFP